MTGKQIFIALISGWLLTACVDEEPAKIEVEKPQGLIEKPKLILIMSDVAVLESHIQRELPRPEQYSLPMKRSVDSILLDYDVTFDQYSESFNYYGVQQDEIKEIYQAVFDTISNRNNVLRERSLKKPQKK